MKARDGFVLRNLAGERLLLPAGDRIRDFSMVIVMNELTAFVWEKLQCPVSRQALLDAVLDEYDTDRDTASRDLDSLLEKLRGYGLLEES